MGAGAAEPSTPLPADTLKAVANALPAIAGGRKELVQQALDFLESGPADRLPELPSDYVARTRVRPSRS